MKKILLLSVVVALCSLLWACQKKSSRADASGLRRYEFKGKVVSLEPEKKRAKIAHDAIPGFMDAMTMSFIVKDDASYGKLQPGDEIRATLVYNENDNRSWLENLQISKGAAPSSSS